MSALLLLIRPQNGLIACAAVVVGAFIARRPLLPLPAALGALAAFAAASGANALNDVVDRSADAVNRPARPIPSGAVRARTARLLAVAAYVAALALGLAVGPGAGALAAAWVALTALYSLTLKGVPIAGNAVVALVGGSPLVMGALSQGRAGRAVLPFALAALAHFAREIVKDVEDVEGDRAAGTRTTAVALGPAVSLSVARVAMVALIGAAVVPFALGLFGWGYAFAVIVIDVILVIVLGLTGAGAALLALHRASALLKIVMVLGLAAFALGVI